MPYKEFIDFIAHNDWAYLWFTAIGAGLFVIAFSSTKSKEKQSPPTL